MEDDAVGLDRAGDADRVQERGARLVADLLVRGCEVDQVERVADDRPDPRLGPRLLEALDVLRRVVGRPPGARALREDLDRLGPAVDRPLDGGMNPSGGGDVGPGQHGTTIAGALLRSRAVQRVEGCSRARIRSASAAIIAVAIWGSWLRSLRNGRRGSFIAWSSPSAAIVAERGSPSINPISPK